jgi:hypothetical protein
MMSDLVHNELIKSLAQFFNNLGIACLLAGGFAAIFNMPVIHVKTDLSTIAVSVDGAFNLTAFASFICGLILCWMCVLFARHKLKQLKE